MNISYTIICFFSFLNAVFFSAGHAAAGVGAFPEDGKHDHASFLAEAESGIIVEPKVLFSSQVALDLEFAGEIAYEEKEGRRQSDDDSFVDQGFSRVKSN